MRRKKNILSKLWHFIWEEDSIASWIVNIVLAFILVKFVIYPGLGLMLGTSHPVVAVVSGSMTHEGLSFNEWWEQNKNWYSEEGFNKKQFQNSPFHNGFNEGDIMVLFGTKPENIKTGQIIVYQSRPDYPPIIHRVISKEKDDNKIFFRTKGDHNSVADKERISEERLIGKAMLRIPYLGWVKIIFTNTIKILIR